MTHVSENKSAVSLLEIPFFVSPLLPRPSVGELEVRHHKVLVVLDVLRSHTEYAAL